MFLVEAGRATRLVAARWTGDDQPSSSSIRVKRIEHRGQSLLNADDLETLLGLCVDKVLAADLQRSDGASGGRESADACKQTGEGLNY